MPPTKFGRHFFFVQNTKINKEKINEILMVSNNFEISTQLSRLAAITWIFIVEWLRKC